MKKISLIHVNNSFQYHVIGVITVNNIDRIIPILIDTGASYSCISEIFCKNKNEMKKSVTVHNFENKKETYNSYEKVLLKFENLEPFKLNIMISKYDKNYLILGNDFLENFKYEIYENFLMLDNQKILRIKLHHETILKLLSE